MSDPALEDLREHAKGVFEVSSRTGLMEIGESHLRLTPDGLQCFDEMLVYFSNHERADIAKRAMRLREALHDQ